MSFLQKTLSLDNIKYTMSVFVDSDQTFYFKILDVVTALVNKNAQCDQGKINPSDIRTWKQLLANHPQNRYSLPEFFNDTKFTTITGILELLYSAKQLSSDDKKFLIDWYMEIISTPIPAPRSQSFPRPSAPEPESELSPKYTYLQSLLHLRDKEISDLKNQINARDAIIRTLANNFN
ncbi:hypothetical protein DLEV_156 [Diachasmimorpha longicaudata entomopoxvirus]|uniref:Uncharacterized protein n=1 Tax=Diachasmimorpha longicaudata entomopoxvirus TaxID=109981 RepID=A0A7R5WUF2_9POXV|nr:hypothetical protein QKK69_gp156 [Diachasmimorpha longicaudata entomopoxvirus]AKS26447.1 hypothetical protein DLEV_156 [Diachasmimorpha longicaudata entomopoxvirus]